MFNLLGLTAAIPPVILGFGIVVIVMSVFLIIAVLMQQGKQHNLSGTIAGAADTFFGKTKGSTISKKLSDERSGSVRAEVSMPQLESVSLSGAAALKANGTFPDLQRRPFLLDMSGATHARGLSVSAYEAKIVLSGATEADLTGDFDEVSLDISGAGKLKLDTKCPELEAELSGSARADLKGEFKEVSIEASGAARADLESAGALHELDIEGSGAASIDTRNAKAQEVSVELSGAANCRVSAIRRITVEATGASTCTYEAEADTKVDIIQIARGASLRKL